MNLERCKERGIQLLSLVPLALLVAALTCPATDLEPPWGDAATPSAADGVAPDGAVDAPTGTAAGEDDAASADYSPGPPALAPARCWPPEIEAAGVCLILGSHSVAMRWKTDRPAAGRVRCRADGGEASAEASAALTEQRVVAMPFVPGVVYGCEVVGATAHGEVTLAAFDVQTAGDGPWVAISEVLANPIGPEPAQEFVEIVNLGDDAADLGGWTLADDGGGSVIAEDVRLAAGEVALLVADAYDPDGGGDPPAATGTRLIRVGRAIGAQGLRNSGEQVRLLDPEGTTVSVFPNTLGTLGDGVSAVRRPPEAPEADEAAWMTSEEGGPTPGWIDR